MPDVTIDYKDCKMTLLTSEQVFGKERLSFFKTHTNKCFATDFAIAMGCDAYEDEYVGKKKELMYRLSPWYLSTRYVNPDTEESYWKLGNHYNYHRVEGFRKVGIRPILQYNNIEYNKMYPIWKRSTIKLFEYPQDIVDEKTSEILEKNITTIHFEKPIKHIQRIFQLAIKLNFILGNMMNIGIMEKNMFE